MYTLKTARIANVDEVGKFKDIPAMQTSLLWSSKGVRINSTRNSAVAERPRDLCIIEYFAVTQDHSMSFEMTPLSKTPVNLH